MTHLLDTDTCIAVLRNRPATVRQLQSRSPDDCAISAVSAFELRAGAARARDPKSEQRKLDLLFATIAVLPFDAEAAAHSGLIRFQLEAAGTPIGPYAIMIGGHAMALGLILATGNTDEFKRIAGLPIENWA